jgi:glycosyltransferase involved in cell wall biosynthesis
MLKEDKKLSVVLCTYNGSAYLKKQLNSILEQTYPIEEIIIVDDCSTDLTKEILSQYQKNHQKIKIFFNERNLGSNMSFKYAISLAGNEYIALCDQDDIWFNNKLEIQMNYIINSGHHLDEKPLVVFHDLCLMDKDENIINNSFWKLHNFKVHSFTFRKLLISNIVTGCTCLINKSMKEELIKCDMKDIFMHDYLIGLIGYGFGNFIPINQQLMYFRSHSSSVTEKEKLTFLGRVKDFFNRIGNSAYLMPYILQIETFNKFYGCKLNVETKKDVQQLIELKNKKIMSKIIYRWFLN